MLILDDVAGAAAHSVCVCECVQEGESVRERRKRLLGGGGQDDDEEANEIMPPPYLGCSAYLWSQKGLI